MPGPSVGTLISAVAAVLLVVSLFLDWFDPDLSAWTVFEVWDMVLAALALAVLARLASELGVFRGPRVPLGVVAAAALVIVFVALVNHPPAAVGRELSEGAWIALGAAVLLVIGAVTAEAHLTVTVDRSSRRTPESGPPPRPPRD